MRDLWDKKFGEIFFSQVISLFGGLIAGTILAVYTHQILLLPGMLILLPGFLEMRGSISGSIAARLTSGLYLGIVKPNTLKTAIVKGNVIASFLLALFVSFLLGVIAFFFTLVVFSTYSPKLLFIPLIAGIIANALEIPLALLVTFYLFRHGYDPADIMGPFVTSTGDITSILSLLLVMVFL